jgi:hypothetical protein
MSIRKSKISYNIDTTVPKHYPSQYNLSSFKTTFYTETQKLGGLWVQIHNPFNLLQASGFFTYHPASHSKILHGARFPLSVVYGSQDRQRPLLYISLTDWFFIAVFTGRYGLIPYIKQITFRL